MAEKLDFMSIFDYDPNFQSLMTRMLENAMEHSAVHDHAVCQEQSTESTIANLGIHTVFSRVFTLGSPVPDSISCRQFDTANTRMYPILKVPIPGRVGGVLVSAPDLAISDTRRNGRPLPDLLFVVDGTVGLSDGVFSDTRFQYRG